MNWDQELTEISTADRPHDVPVSLGKTAKKVSHFTNSFPLNLSFQRLFSRSFAITRCGPSSPACNSDGKVKQWCRASRLQYHMMHGVWGDLPLQKQ